MAMSDGPAAGIDLGGTKIEVAVFDPDWKVLGQARNPTPSEGTPEDVAQAIVTAAREACEAAGIGPSSLSGVGVGTPGAIDADAGTVANARNVSPKWLAAYPLGPELERALGARVIVGNDVQVATDAEYELGAGREYRSLLGVFWGTGIGGGLILDGEAWHGRGAGGEIGHTIVKVDGRRCQCGGRGHLEAYAGRASMEARARKRHSEGERTDLFKIMERRGRTRLTSAVWAKALEAGDRLATELIGEAVTMLAAGIASAVNLLDVEAVIIGGGLGVRFGDPVVRRIESAMKPLLFNDDRPPALHVAALGDLGGAMGAALLARRVAGAV
jgi:glucokinase